MELWYVSVSTWHHACWNNMKRVFLHEPPELWHFFQLTNSFICSTVKESAVLVWVRQGRGGGSVVCVRVNTATCLLKQHENSFQARTMTAMTILPAYKLFYFLYRKGIGCASMGKTRSWWWICSMCPCRNGTMAACWKDTKIVFLQEPWQLWQYFQLTDSFICSTVKELAAIVWVWHGS